MDRPKEKETSNDIACRALERMDMENVSPTPNNYEVWYAYFSGNPEIVSVVDNLKVPIDEAICLKIYKRYLSAAQREKSVDKISNQVHEAIANLTGLFSDIQIATTSYGETMENVSDKIGNAASLDELGDVVSAIAQDTKKMVERNQALENELQSSSSQVEELQKNLVSIRKEAMTDSLTKLANRKAFDQYLQDCIDETEEDDVTLTLLMIDIDHFKKFNDDFGHQTGDQVLRLVAKSLTDGIKGRDMAARYGGEEFVIILPETAARAGEIVGNALRKAVERKEIVNKSSNENLGRITMSVGVAEFIEGETAEGLIERADVALYQAKDAGRNQVVVSS